MQEGQAADQVPRKGVLSSSVGLASREAAGPVPPCQVLQSLEFDLVSVWNGEGHSCCLLGCGSREEKPGRSSCWEIGGVAAGRPGDRSQGQSP